ncbi:MAG: hypothetical protein HKN87_11735 [Saprospiraceae bacterium]|nr:hypothetical protein [Saprospiraceae bacterium]
MKVCTSIFWLLFLAGMWTSGFGQQSLRPLGLVQKSSAILSVGDLRVTFVDNQAYGDHHRAGYNGIASLIHIEEKESPFVSRYAGFNLEHIFGGDTLEKLFEPRIHPMELFQVDSNQVLLYQSPTPLSNVESLTSFTVVAPHYIDVNFKCKIQQSGFFRHNYAGLFWASYIQTPDDPNIYFKGYEGNESEPTWQSTYSPKHGQASTHRSASDHQDLYFHPDFNAPLASHFSDYRYSHPYYYGRYKQMVLAYFFDATQIIRFSQSPTGGGSGNPAWDFQFMIPNFISDKAYSFKARLVYKPFKDVQDIDSEYLHWKN